MYSGTRKLGESQEMDADVQDSETSDLDFITTNYLSPDSGYSDQRISNYDVELAQHQTLNGRGLGAWLPNAGRAFSRLPAAFRGNFLQRAVGPIGRTVVGAPRGGGMVAPRGLYFNTRAVVQALPVRGVPMPQRTGSA